MTVKNNFKEILVALILVVIAILLLNPFHFWMPDMFVMAMLACALVFFGIFASFVLKEKVRDERDEMHRTLSGRNAFLAGSFFLMLGIVIQGYSHAVDPWLVVTLVIMIFTKLATRIWSEKNL